MMFSVIIPVYNAEKYLRPCLDSVLNQTETDWECVCVDDGSTDSSGAILDEYAKRDSRFRVVHQTNGGVSVARNSGLDVACGEWVTWLDADDMYRVDRLAEARRLIARENPDLIRFGFYMARQGETEIPVDFNPTCEYSIFEGAKAQKWGWQILAPSGMVWTWVARRGLVQSLRFPLNMRIKEDSIFCAGMANKLQKVVQSECIAYFYRWTASSAMHSVRKADDCVRLIRAVIDLYQSPQCSRKDLAPDVRLAMVRWLRAHAESDIIDWVRMRQGEHDRNREIRLVYRELVSAGLCACSMGLQCRMRFPFWWWAHTGQSWLINLECRAEAFARTLLRRG